MATLKCANVTKYDDGGSGDNYIADGFIKSVEKIWSDSYAVGTAAIGSDDSIAIGRVPKGKKIQDVQVYIPALGASSNATVFIGTAATFLMTAASCYLGALVPDGVAAGTDEFIITAGQMLRLKGDKFATEPNKDVVLYAKIVIEDGTDSTVTAGTIRTLIKYT